MDGDSLIRVKRSRRVRTRAIAPILALLLLWPPFAPAAGKAAVPLTAATPESQGLDPMRLGQAVRQIRAGVYGDINSLLVLRNDYLVLEEYFSPQYHGRDYRHPAKSITKSVTSALIGIALAQGRIESLQTGLPALFPQYPHLAAHDSPKRQITLEQLLTMTAGFQWDEFTPGYNSSDKMVASPDWIEHVLDLPLAHAIGERWTYNSGCSMLLSDILARAVGRPVDEFAREVLFEPIGVENYNWSIGKKGVINTGWGLAMSRRDLARIGVLYLNEGRWGERQIVPADWVRESTRPQVLGVDDYFPYAYGYHWWRLQDPEPTVAMLAVNDAFFALGFGGQFVFVVPHLELVVVSTAANFADDMKQFFGILREHIFPALRP